jgi:hypothetical protein
MFIVLQVLNVRRWLGQIAPCAPLMLDEIKRPRLANDRRALSAPEVMLDLYY